LEAYEDETIVKLEGRTTGITNCRVLGLCTDSKIPSDLTVSEPEITQEIVATAHPNARQIPTAGDSGCLYAVQQGSGEETHYMTVGQQFACVYKKEGMYRGLDLIFLTPISRILADIQELTGRQLEISSQA